MLLTTLTATPPAGAGSGMSSSNCAVAPCASRRYVGDKLKKRLPTATLPCCTTYGMPRIPQTTSASISPAGTRMPLSELPLADRLVPVGDERRSIVNAGPDSSTTATLLKLGDADAMTMPLP